MSKFSYKNTAPGFLQENHASNRFSRHFTDFYRVISDSIELLIGNVELARKKFHPAFQIANNQSRCKPLPLD